MGLGGRAVRITTAILLGAAIGVPIVPPAQAQNQLAAAPAAHVPAARLPAARLPAAQAAAAAPATACTIADQRLDELSGLSVSGQGYVAINDGSDDKKRRRIFYLTSRCAVSRTVSYPSRPRDAEDLAVAPDGTLWVADIGDNDRTRDTVGLWKLAPGGSKPVLHRFTYPDGPHDAEALLLNGDGTPIIVTKDPLTAGLYVPTAAPRAKATVPLRRAGSFGIPGTSTSNPFGLRGRFVVTGGAVSADGRKAALRTYADAFEFAVTDGDVIAAVTDGKAATTPLPDEPQGESLAYSADGASLLTVSEKAEGPAPKILRYASALPNAEPSAAAPTTASARPASPAAVTGSRPIASTTQFALAGLGVAGVLVLALVTLVLIHRRSRT